MKRIIITLILTLIILLKSFDKIILSIILMYFDFLYLKYEKVLFEIFSPLEITSIPSPVSKFSITNIYMILSNS